MKIAILGAGAMGQLFGAHLLAAGQNVILIDSSEATCDSINRNGIKVNIGTHEFHVHGKAAKAEKLDEPVDIIMVFTKGFHSEGAVSSIRHLVSDKTVGVSLQNGLGNEKPLVKVFGEDQTIVGVTDFPSDRAQDGTIHTERTGQVILGGLVTAGNTGAKLVADVLHKSGLNAQFHADVIIPIWEKVIFNTVYNTVSAATGLSVGGVFDEPEARKLATEILEESLNVVRKEGVEIDEGRLHKNIVKAHQHHTNHKTSMLIDIESGRPTEIESIGGAVERIGKTNGISTDTLSVLCDVIRLRERSR